MANEIQFPYVTAGLTTLTATLFKSGSSGAGASAISGIPLSDSTSSSVYWGSVPTSPAPTAGQYSVVVYDGANVVGSGELDWDGTSEVVELTAGQVLTAVKPSLQVINDGLKSASLLIPHTSDLPA